MLGYAPCWPVSCTVICSFGWRIWPGPFQASLFTWNGSFRALCFPVQKQTLLSLYPGQKGFVCWENILTAGVCLKRRGWKGSEPELSCWVDRGGENASQPGFVVGSQQQTILHSHSWISRAVSVYANGMQGYAMPMVRWVLLMREASWPAFFLLTGLFSRMIFKVCCSEAGVCPPHLVTLW